MKIYTPSARGVAAYAVVLGFVGVLLILIGMLSSTSISGRFLTHRYSNDEKANQLAEAATNLVFRMVAEEMNDPKAMFELLRFKFKKENINSWFWKFRFPMPYLGAGIDKEGSINGEDAAGGELGAELSIDLGTWFNSNDMTYTSVQLLDLDPLIAELGGTASITSTARIAKSYGILPKTAGYKVPGITVDTSKVAKGPRDWLCNFINALGSDVEFRFDFKETILKAIPEELNLGTLIGKVVEELKINYAVSAGIAIPIPFGKIAKPLLENLITSLAGDSLSLRGVIGKALDEMDVDLSFNFTDYKNKLKDLIQGMLPDYIVKLSGTFEAGYSMEKIGIFEVKTIADYRPRGITGPTIRRVLRTQREFRVADIQPVAPDYSFFLANSPLLFEDASKENKTGWKGGDKIDWTAGQGAFVVHNLTLFDTSILKRLTTFLSALSNWKTEELNNALYLPGLVRINGTATQEIPLNFGLLNAGTFLERLKHCEIAALLVCDDENRHYDLKAKQYPTKTGAEGTDYVWNYRKHNIVPAFGESIYGTGFEAPPPLSCLSPLAPVPHFDWPWVTDSWLWLPIPTSYNSTHLFGDFHVEFPMKLRVEGNVWKKFSRLKLPLVRIYLPLTAICGFDIDITVPSLPVNEVIVEPYGFCTYPPLENAEGKTDVDGMAEEWNHTKPENLPENVYSPTQYLKKASYFYRTGDEFVADIENRVTSVNVGGEERKAFVCDGVSYVEGGLTLPEMNVTGRGIIVCGGNITIGGGIRRIDRPDAPLTLFSLVARNGAVINTGDNTVEACLYGDRGLMNAPGNRIRIFGNLVVNQFNRSDSQGNIDVHYESNRCHSSFISYFKNIAKYDITRYQVNLSKKWRMFQYEKGE